MLSNAADSGACAVFVFAHQDDEFGCFTALEDALSQGVRPLCFYLTDGGGGSADPTARCAESLAVLQAIGVPETDVFFIGVEASIPDGQLSQHADRALDSVLEKLVGGQQAPQRLLIHAWEGGHPDHDAAHLIGLALAHRLGGLQQTEQFSLYHGAGLKRGLFRVLSPLAANGPVQVVIIPWKRRLRHLSYCCRYPSQWKTWLGLLPFVTLHYLTAGSQQTQAVHLHRLSQRPHEGGLLYEERGMALWDRFVDDVRDFAEAHFGDGVMG